MPMYEFRNKETGEIFEQKMMIAELDKFKEDNPHLEQVHTGMAPLGDSVRLGITKPDSTFEKYVLGRIKESVPGNTLSQKKVNGPREW